MILLIGSKICNRCLITKNILENKNIKYEYKTLEELISEEQSLYLKMAEEVGQMSMPLIIKDGIIIKLEEVEQCI